MKFKKTIIGSVVILLSLGGVQAQESINASGGNTVGTGGSVSYSVGELVYTTKTGSNGSLVEGIQQPYEIYTTLGIKETSINLGLSAYPNPTTDYLTLKVEEMDNLNYQLFDMQGKLIIKRKVLKKSTIVSMERLEGAVYFLNIIKNNKLIKTFKIIKN